MLTPFYTLIKSYGLKVNGIIHVGAHFGEEHSQYLANGIEHILFIEPSKKAFDELKKNTAENPKAKCINLGCAAYEGKGTLYVETANKGQSNSLLKPKLHTEQYPDIKFDGKEEIEVDLLDNIYAWHSWMAKFNMLVMDVQGYELEVLKGADYTLRDMDYIYTEVNRAELYENCAHVDQLDAFLEDFERVNTNWAGGTWGDALYIRKNLK